jgi:hypothetical protein
VITDSTPWKIELLRIADRLERKKTQRRWTEQTGFLVERDVMVGAYALRKLLEARKISDLLANRQVLIKEHVLLEGSRPPDMHNRYFIWENYDLDVCKEHAFTLWAFCNQIIHSWNWMISATEDDQFDGFYVSSDRERRSSLYFVAIDLYIELLRAVGSETVVSITMGRDKKGEMHIISVMSDDMGRNVDT